MATQVGVRVARSSTLYLNELVHRLADAQGDILYGGMHAHGVLWYVHADSTCRQHMHSRQTIPKHVLTAVESRDCERCQNAEQRTTQVQARAARVSNGIILGGVTVAMILLSA